MTTPPQSDTVVEVSPGMRLLVDDYAIECHFDGEYEITRDTDEDTIAAKERLLQEIARLEHKAWMYDELCK